MAGWKGRVCVRVGEWGWGAAGEKRGSRGSVGAISSVAERANWEVRSLICSAAPVARLYKQSAVCLCVCVSVRTA